MRIENYGKAWLDGMEINKINVQDYKQTDKDNAVNAYQQQMNRAKSQLNSLDSKRDITVENRREKERELKQEIRKIDEKIRVAKDSQKKDLDRNLEKKEVFNNDDKRKEYLKKVEQDEMAREEARKRLDERNLAQRTDRSNESANGGRDDNANRTNNAGRTDNADRTNNAGRTDDAARANNPNRTNGANRGNEFVTVEGNDANRDTTRPGNANGDNGDNNREAINLDFFRTLVHRQNVNDMNIVSFNADRQVNSQQRVERSEIDMDKARGADTKKREQMIENANIDVARVLRQQDATNKFFFSTSA